MRREYESKGTGGWGEELASRLFPIHSVKISRHQKSHEAVHRVLIEKTEAWMEEVCTHRVLQENKAAALQ